MEHLTSETIKKFAAGQYPFAELLKISSHLSICDELCQKKLNELVPKFLIEADALELERERVIQTHEHFSAKAISDYAGKRIKLDQRLAMNEYFTKCAVCAENLKHANPDYISDFIKDTLAGNKSMEVVSAKPQPGWSFPVLIPAGALILLFGLMLGIVWLKSDQTEFDQAKLDSPDFPSPIANVGNLNSESGPDEKNIQNRVAGESNKIAEKSKPEKTQTRGANEKNADVLSKTQTKPVNNSGNKIIAKNRSLDKNCDSLTDLAVTPNNEIITDTQPILKWKPIPKATAYQVFLTDTKSNLIEEGATKNHTETSYKLTKKLELNKKYEWKVIATLDDGKEIFGETTQFSVGDKARKLTVVRNKTKINEVRCLNSPKK